MKKLMKKIKSNKLIPKLVAVLTICMVLLSSLSVSVFATDDEVSAANEETESITDVWTSVMNWITSSLGSAQGVFLTESGDYSFILDSSQIFEITDSSLGTLYFTPILGFDPSGAVPGVPYDFSLNSDLLVFEFSDVEGNSFFYSSDFDFPMFVRYSSLSSITGIEPDIWYYVNSESFLGTLTLTTPFIHGPSTVSLSFLGTLAVIGVAIAIAFLLIGLISRFLRLRG